jgi:hypothetical protein
MLTCFIKNDFIDPSKDMAVYALLTIPLCFVIYSFYAFVKIFQKRKVQTDRDFKVAILKYLMYSILYILFYFPTIILYVVSINQRTPEGTALSQFSYYCTISTISVNLALCLFRIFEGYVESILSDDSSSVFVHDVTVYSNNSDFKDTSINVLPKKKSLWRKVESDMIKGVKIN